MYSLKINFNSLSSYLVMIFFFQRKEKEAWVVFGLFSVFIDR